MAQPSTPVCAPEVARNGDLTNAFAYCKSLLEIDGLLIPNPPETISAIAIAIGKVIYEQINILLEERHIIEEEELVFAHEVKAENAQEYTECPNKPEAQEFDREYERAAPWGSACSYVPFDYKEKAVAMSKVHPKWSVGTLRSKGFNLLKSPRMLRTWREDVRRGGTKWDKWRLIADTTLEKFLGARNSLEPITTRNIQEWAMQAAYPLLSDNFQFSAGRGWLASFKRRNNIRQRRVTHFVSDREHAPWEETLAAASNFQLQTRAMMVNFDREFVINTNQTGCECHIPYQDSSKGFKSPGPQKKRLNRISHCYTAQYTLTASGKVLPIVLLCMRESVTTFGPIEKSRIEHLMEEYKNVYVSWTKSGKLCNETYKRFLSSCLRPYVGSNKCLLLVDSWTGQTDLSMYDDIFVDDLGKATSTVKMIPPKCTPLCQPCEAYFYRQVKLFLERMYNHLSLRRDERETGSREDAIRMHSLIAHQLTAPVFEKMVLYAWHSSNLLEGKKPVSNNINDICFPVRMLQGMCACTQTPFIICAHCKKMLCFPCFFDAYHPGMCTIGTSSGSNVS